MKFATQEEAQRARSPRPDSYRDYRGYSGGASVREAVKMRRALLCGS